jgi:hypothetical protein
MWVNLKTGKILDGNSLEEVANFAGVCVPVIKWHKCNCENCDQADYQLGNAIDEILGGDHIRHALNYKAARQLLENARLVREKRETR